MESVSGLDRLKFHSDWQTGENNGITDPMTMDRLAELTGFGKQTVCDAIKELQKAGMLERLSKPWEASVFQLYPKPIPKTEAECQREKHERTKVKVGRWEVVTTPHHVYSGNKKWRCRYIDGRWEKRDRSRDMEVRCRIASLLRSRRLS